MDPATPSPTQGHRSWLFRVGSWALLLLLIEATHFLPWSQAFPLPEQGALCTSDAAISTSGEVCIPLDHSIFIDHGTEGQSRTYTARLVAASSNQDVLDIFNEMLDIAAISLERAANEIPEIGPIIARREIYCHTAPLTPSQRFRCPIDFILNCNSSSPESVCRTQNNRIERLHWSDLTRRQSVIATSYLMYLDWLAIQCRRLGISQCSAPGVVGREFNARFRARWDASHPQATPPPAARNRVTPTPARRTQPAPTPARRNRVTPTPARRTQPAPTPARRNRVTPTPARRTQPAPRPARRTRVTPTPVPQPQTPPSRQTPSAPGVAPQAVTPPAEPVTPPSTVPAPEEQHPSPVSPPTPTPPLVVPSPPHPDTTPLPSPIQVPNPTPETPTPPVSPEPTAPGVNPLPPQITPGPPPPAVNPTPQRRGDVNRVATSAEAIQQATQDAALCQSGRGCQMQRALQGQTALYIHSLRSRSGGAVITNPAALVVARILVAYNDLLTLPEITWTGQARPFLGWVRNQLNGPLRTARTTHSEADGTTTSIDYAPSTEAIDELLTLLDRCFAAGNAPPSAMDSLANGFLTALASSMGRLPEMDSASKNFLRAAYNDREAFTQAIRHILRDIESRDPGSTAAFPSILRD
jgi:hypothetical protein